MRDRFVVAILASGLLLAVPGNAFAETVEAEVQAEAGKSEVALGIEATAESEGNPQANGMQLYFAGKLK